MHDRLLTMKMDWTTHVMRESDVHIDRARRGTHPFDETQQTGHSGRDTMEGNGHNYPINGQRRGLCRYPKEEEYGISKRAMWITTGTTVKGEAHTKR